MERRRRAPRFKHRAYTVVDRCLRSCILTLTRQRIDRAEVRMAHPSTMLDQLRATLRRKRYAIRTEEAYMSRSTRYIRFHQLRHPQELGTAEVEAFLTKGSSGETPALPRLNSKLNTQNSEL
jgi:hypothetical protein